MARSSALPITVRQLTKRYGKTTVLDHVDLDVRPGEFLTLLGPSGSGKTTLLSVLAGFTRPDSGSVAFGPTEVVTAPPHRRGVGMVFQNYALFPHMSVAGNVAFPLGLRKVPRDEIDARVERALETVRLGGYGGRGIDQLSGGQRQRVALARAIVFEPQILLMDEPLSALDKQLREHMQIELRQLHDQLGMTTVYVTHDQREALTMSDRIAVIDRGRLMQLDTPRAIYERPANRFVAEFIGESAFVPVQLAGGVVSFGERPLRTQRELPARDGRHWLMLRPEHITLAHDATAPDHNLLDARLRAIVYQGDSSLLQVELNDGTPLGVRCGTDTLAGAAPLARGDALRLAFDPRHACLIADDAGHA